VPRQWIQLWHFHILARQIENQKLYCQVYLQMSNLLKWSANEIRLACITVHNDSRSINFKWTRSSLWLSPREICQLGIADIHINERMQRCCFEYTCIYLHWQNRSCSHALYPSHSSEKLKTVVFDSDLIVYVSI